jgi:bifunctional ADP-heptose synthase (sugar kinase/adenylyltransferase)
MDVKWRGPTPADVEDRIIAELDAVLPEVGAVIIADQVQERNRGVITDRIRDFLADRAGRYPDTVFFADSRTRIGEFRRVIIKPNAGEAARHLGAEADPERGAVDQAAEHAARLALRTGRPVFVTLGANGILVYEDGRATHVPAIPVEGPIDIVGAGDSTVAGAVSALSVGATCPEAALVGNLVASITIQQLGTTGTATPEQVKQRFDEAFATP